MKKFKQTALLVVDLINDIVHESGKTPSCAKYVEDNKVIQFVNKAINLLRENYVPIMFVKIAFSSDYREHPKDSPMFSNAYNKNALKLGTWGTEFHKDLDYRADDTVLIKHRVSPFYGTAIEPILNSLNVNTIIITGVSTNNAVQVAARDAHDRDYKVIIAEDACGAGNNENHNNALQLVGCLAKIVKVEQLFSLYE